MESFNVEWLRCPVTGQGMRMGNEEELKSLLERQSDGKLIDLSGSEVTGKIDAIFVSEDGARAYPVLDGIPILLPGSGIPV
jgi:uncharacterized protein YbaR (Trm112 family)